MKSAFHVLHVLVFVGKVPMHAIKAYGRVELQLHSLLIPAVDVGEWSASCPGRFTWCVQVLRSPKEAFAAAMQSWRERCEKCVCLQGDYVENSLHFQLPVVSSLFLNKLGDLRT